MSTRVIQPTYHRSPGARRRAGGATLIVGMVLLMLMTSIALTTLKAVKTDEHLTGNLQDRSRAFQAAEAALREAEKLLRTSPPICDGTNGRYLYTDPSIPMPFAFDDNNAIRYSGTLSGVNQQPLYIIEQMGAAPPLVPGQPSGLGASYRVTALGYGGSANTRAVLQITYKL